MVIRDAVEANLPRIIEIYNSTIPGRLATADTEEISVESRWHWFREHSPDSRPLWIVEKEETIIGWLSFQSFYGRPAYRGTAELSIYIDASYRRQGLGKKLLQKAIYQCPNLAINTLLAFIFAHNEASLNLFDKFQFSEWGYLPRVAELDDVERDLVIMGRRVR